MLIVHVLHYSILSNIFMEPAAVANKLGVESHIDLGRSVGRVLTISSMVAGIDLSTPSAHFTPA